MSNVSLSLANTFRIDFLYWMRVCVLAICIEFGNIDYSKKWKKDQIEQTNFDSSSNGLFCSFLFVPFRLNIRECHRNE